MMMNQQVQHQHGTATQLLQCHECTLWPYDSEELVDYGVGDIAVLVNHYRILFTDEEVDNIPLEWPTLKSQSEVIYQFNQLTVMSVLCLLWLH